jgi:hypothetical protein
VADIVRHTLPLALPLLSSFFFCEWNQEKYFSLITKAKGVDSLHDQGSRSACASASMEGESLFAADGCRRRGRERYVLFCGLRFPRSGEHNPHAPSGGDGCAAALAVFAKISECVCRAGTAPSRLDVLRERIR